MKNLNERISYLQGLGEGMKVLETGPSGKIIVEMLSVISDIVKTMDRFRNDYEDFKIYVESIDEDLLDLEEDIYGDEEEDEDDENYIEVRCDNCGEDVYFESDWLEEDDVIEVVCPKCNEVVYVNDGSFDFDPFVIQEGAYLQPKGSERREYS